MKKKIAQDKQKEWKGTSTIVHVRYFNGAKHS
jgi:hypothetical protein